MSYTEADVIWDGALAESKVFPEDAPTGEFDSWLADVKQEAADDTADSVVEVYTLFHDHDPELDCECSQFVTSHHPYWSNSE